LIAPKAKPAMVIGTLVTILDYSKVRIQISGSRPFCSAPPPRPRQISLF
jgi:hypothetical protein